MNRTNDQYYFHLLSQKLNRVSKIPVKLMEVCGTHTMAIGKAGIRQVLPPAIELVSGPGCPVCVTADGEIDAFLDLACLPGVIMTTYGDMIRVPGSKGSLRDIKAQGADIRVVYSPMEALELARRERNREIVFLGVGFETTAPASAHALLTARRENIENFSIFNLHKTVPRALEALLDDTSMLIDGFILPGHVSAIIGEKVYSVIADRYGVSGVIAGFTAPEIMAAVLKLVLLKQRGEPAVTNQYSHIVSYRGNTPAQNMLRETFKPCDAQWRGLGNIPGSGLKLNSDYLNYDAAVKFGISIKETKGRRGCRCGNILKGLAKPPACPLFGTTCLPESPVGPCMVSSEGACAAYYLYEGGELP